MNLIPHNRLTIGIYEERAACRVLRSGWLAQGNEVEGFENDLCDFLKIPRGHAVAVSSGTAALYLSLLALNASHKKIGMPVYACSALRHAVRMAQGKEVFLDIAESQPNLDLAMLEKKSPEIAIVPHLFGIPTELSELNGISVIEDCAQALGAKVNGVHAGLQGDLGVFSFYATKLMTSGGQGGAVVSRHKAPIEWIRDYRLFDMQRKDRPRFNFQMTDLQAAVGRTQLKQLPRFLKKREQIFKAYLKTDLAWVREEKIEISPVRYRAVFRTSRPEKVLQRLKQKKIQAIVPIEDWELLAKPFPRALHFSRSTVSVPIYPSLTPREVETIIKALNQL